MTVWSTISAMTMAKPMLLALHERSVVAIAHGYAKVTGKPMAVVVHSNVGLMCWLDVGVQCLVRPRARS